MTHPATPKAITEEGKQNLALLARARGTSLRDIADQIGTSHPTASKWIDVAQARLDGYARGAGLAVDWNNHDSVLGALLSMTTQPTPRTPGPPDRTPGLEAPTTLIQLPPTPTAEPAPAPTPEPVIEPVAEPLTAPAQTALEPTPHDPFDAHPEPTPDPHPEPTPPAPRPDPEDNPWPMSHDEMDYLAQTFKASHYEPEHWPHWAKRLDVGIDPTAYQAIETLYPDEHHRQAVYATILNAIHTGKNAAWRWVGVNLSLHIPEHQLFTWCQMRADGYTIEIKFANPRKH